MQHVLCVYACSVAVARFDFASEPSSELNSVTPRRVSGWIDSLTQLNGSVKEPNKFYNCETEKITRKASDAAEYIDLFGSST